jgi:DNA modification methylase
MRIATSKLKTNPNNPRSIRKDQLQKLVKSLREFPEMLEARPIVVDPDFVVLGGNMRLKAAQEAGLKEVPVYIASWEEAKHKEFIIKDNGHSGEWDQDMLANDGWDTEELKEWGVPIDWDPVQETEGLTDPDDVPAVQEEPTTKPGDLWILGDHRLLCGDSTNAADVERLMDGKKADMVFTDPPYGMSYESNAWDSKNKDVQAKRTDSKILNDETTNVGKRALNLLPSLTKSECHFYIWCRWDCFNDFFTEMSQVAKIKGVVVWDKGGPGLGDLECSYGDSEWAIHALRGRKPLAERQNCVWQVNRMKGLQMVHPTQKPIELCERAIKNSTSYNELLLDLFLGSGSTLIAAEKTGRKCYGMELDPKYCDVIVKRWEDFTGKKAELWKQ